MNELVLYHTDLVEVGFFTVNPKESCFHETGFVDDPIIVFPKNSIWIQYDGSEPFVADPTLVNFYNQGQIYQRFAIHQAGDYCHWFKISDELLSEVVGKEKKHFCIENIHCPAKVFLKHLHVLKRISANTHTPDFMLDIEEQVVEIFHELLTQSDMRNRVCNRQYNKHKALVESVKESLHEDLSVNFSLQKLSSLHHTSPYHLSRTFKAINGYGISQYRKQHRLRSLVLELQKRDTELVDLALDHGFSSHSHMSASFKQLFGLTPGDCQRQIYT